jgi:hypothetical protein
MLSGFYYLYPFRLPTVFTDLCCASAKSLSRSQTNSGAKEQKRPRFLLIYLLGRDMVAAVSHLIEISQETKVTIYIESGTHLVTNRNSHDTATLLCLLLHVPLWIVCFLGAFLRTNPNPNRDLPTTGSFRC